MRTVDARSGHCAAAPDAQAFDIIRHAQRLNMNPARLPFALSRAFHFA